MFRITAVLVAWLEVKLIGLMEKVGVEKDQPILLVGNL